MTFDDLDNDQMVLSIGYAQVSQLFAHFAPIKADGSDATIANELSKRLP